MFWEPDLSQEPERNMARLEMMLGACRMAYGPEQLPIWGSC